VHELEGHYGEPHGSSEPAWGKIESLEDLAKVKDAEIDIQSQMPVPFPAIIVRGLALLKNGSRITLSLSKCDHYSLSTYIFHIVGTKSSSTKIASPITSAHKWMFLLKCTRLLRYEYVSLFNSDY